VTDTVTPETDLVARLTAHPCRGTFEAHVTTRAADAAAADRFRGLCGELGVKCVLIELPQGMTRSQPMTASYHRGDLAAAVLSEVVALCRNVRAAGFPVARLKLEAVATNEGIPQEDDEAHDLAADNYFEFHQKVYLPPDADLGALGSLCAAHGGRLSSNALKRALDGRSERFVTLRLYGVGRRTAFARFDRLSAELRAAGYALGNGLREFTLYDSAVSLDAGWIDAPAGAGP
jgi:hypothetical protein